MPVRGAAPLFTTTISVTLLGTPPTPGLTVVWNTHWSGRVNIPVFVSAVITGTSATPASPTRICIFNGAAAPGAQVTVLSSTRRQTRFAVPTSPLPHASVALNAVRQGGWQRWLSHVAACDSELMKNTSSRLKAKLRRFMASLLNTMLVPVRLTSAFISGRFRWRRRPSGATRVRRDTSTSEHTQI
jgi:hypothetical protein